MTSATTSPTAVILTATGTTITTIATSTTVIRTATTTAMNYLNVSMEGWDEYSELDLLSDDEDEALTYSDNNIVDKINEDRNEVSLTSNEGIIIIGTEQEFDHLEREEEIIDL